MKKVPLRLHVFAVLLMSVPLSAWATTPAPKPGFIYTYVSPNAIYTPIWTSSPFPAAGYAAPGLDLIVRGDPFPTEKACFAGESPLTHATYTYKHTVMYPTAKNIVNGASEINLRIHLTYPPATPFGVKGPFPVLLTFNGGGFSDGDPMKWRVLANYFASRGMLVANVEYRTESSANVALNGATPATDGRGYPLGTGGINTYVKMAVADGMSAVRWVRKNASRLRANPNAVVAFGDSAGGGLALALAYNHLAGDETGSDALISSMPNAAIGNSPMADFTLENMDNEVDPVKNPNSLVNTLIIDSSYDPHPWTPLSRDFELCEAVNVLAPTLWRCQIASNLTTAQQAPWPRTQYVNVQFINPATRGNWTYVPEFNPATLGVPLGADGLYDGMHAFMGAAGPAYRYGVGVMDDYITNFLHYVGDASLNYHFFAAQVAATPANCQSVVAYWAAYAPYYGYDGPYSTMTGGLFGPGQRLGQ